MGHQAKRTASLVGMDLSGVDVQELHGPNKENEKDAKDGDQALKPGTLVFPQFVGLTHLRSL